MIENLIDYFKELACKVIKDAITLITIIMIALLILSLIFTWLELKGKIQCIN